MTRLELESLAADRPQKTAELFPANDFYGHAGLLKEYCDWPPEVPLPGIVPHGPCTHTNLWEQELNHRLPNLFLGSEIAREVYSQKCTKACHLIGSPFHYATRLLADEIKTFRQKAAGTLVFTAHSTSLITSQFNPNELMLALRQLPGEFLPLRICLYWRDIQLGRHLPYLEAGFECTTVGHMFDPQFLRRNVLNLAQHKFALSNEPSTSLIYAAASGLGVRLLRQVVSHQGACGDIGSGHALKIKLQFDTACENAGENPGAQGAMAEEILGGAFVREPVELRNLFAQLADELPVTSIKSWLAKKRWARLRRKGS